MPATNAASTKAGLLRRADLQRLIDALQRNDYRVIGPTVRDATVVYDEITNVDEMPIGRGDTQDGGHYRLTDRGDDAVFGYTNGVQSWRRYLFQPRRTLWRAQRQERDFVVEPETRPAPKQAFIGVRACELHAIEIQDKVFVDGAYADADYRARRAAAFVVAVNCGSAGGTCFCASTDTGPRSERGFDLSLTEFLDGADHAFFVEVGSERGAEIAADLPLEAATDADRQRALAISEETAASMGRSMPVDGLKDRLQQNLEHPRWQQVADRCLACSNCTMVCPTCFCSTTEDFTDITGQTAERQQRWDSCFALDHSYLHGGSVRTSTAARYRQWMTHKLAGWIDQFDVSGCVGCGRCITWCPVGIDITEEAAAFSGDGVE